MQPFSVPWTDAPPEERARSVIVLHLAFAGLGAEFAVSDAYTGNSASLGVSRKLGYLPHGIQRQVIRGRPAVIQMLRRDRAGWEAHQRVPVDVDGLASCLPSFGLPPA